MNQLVGQIAEWDWKTIAAIASPVVAVLVVVANRWWSKKESRLQALSGILRPLVRALQRLSDANECRRTCERLTRAYTNPENAKEAVDRVHAKMDEYGTLIAEGSQECKAFEAELAACAFRFPDGVAALLTKARNALFEAGQAVNNGLFDKADLHLAKLKDQYREIERYARGWRLMAPLEGVAIRIRKHFHRPAETRSRYELTEAEMSEILELVTKRATTQASNPFTVHAPAKLLANPAICQADNVVAQLEDSVFEVVFQDGTYKMMTLVELMVFTCQLIALAYSHAEIHRMVSNSGIDPCEIRVSYDFSVEEIMRPEMVKMLLSKMSFSDSPADATDKTSGQQSTRTDDG
jgi:hypothetical protein